MTLAEALEITRQKYGPRKLEIPIGATLVQEYRRCQGACCAYDKRKGEKRPRGHGPYWMAWISGSRRVHIGSQAKVDRIVKAWAIVEAEVETLERKRAEERATELARLEARPASRELARLRAVAGLPAPERRANRRRGRGVVSVPMLDLSPRSAQK